MTPVWRNTGPSSGLVVPGQWGRSEVWGRWQQSDVWGPSVRQSLRLGGVSAPVTVNKVGLCLTCMPLLSHRHEDWGREGGQRGGLVEADAFYVAWSSVPSQAGRTCCLQRSLSVCLFCSVMISELMPVSSTGETGVNLSSSPRRRAELDSLQPAS